MLCGTPCVMSKTEAMASPRPATTRKAMPSLPARVDRCGRSATARARVPIPEEQQREEPRVPAERVLAHHSPRSIELRARDLKHGEQGDRRGRQDQRQSTGSPGIE